MKHFCGSDDGVLAARDCLGNTCGTNIDTGDIEFTNQQPFLTYLDKVFSFNKDTASPILFNLNTGGRNRGRYITQLFLDGRGPFPCTLSGNAVFEVDNAFVVVEYFNTRPPGNINASQVTLDGYPVDSVMYSNGQYTARTANVLPKVQKERCLDRNLPTKVFFLVTNVGPWDFRATYVLEGTVNTNGRLCRFRLEVSNAPNSPNTPIHHNCPSSFAVRNLSLPCSINGIAPDILFQFTAKVNLINPRIIVDSNPGPFLGAENEADCDGFDRNDCWPCHDIDPACEDTLGVALLSTVAVEPVINVQTIRRSLFCINACEGLQPCQGSITSAEIIEDEEDCVIGGVDRPDCSCGRGGNVGGISCGNNVGGVRSRRSCSNNIDRLGCNTQEVPAGIGGEVSIGTGDCSDCVWGNDLVPCRSCGRGNDAVAGARDRGKNRRTAFQFNGTNGCSWY